MTALWRFGWGVARSMGTGDYICVTLRGGAPWGFTLREGEGDTYRPFLVSQVSICLSVCLCVKLTNIKVLIWNRGFLLPVSHCKYVKNRLMKVLLIILWRSYKISKIGPRAPHVWYHFLLISFWVIPCKPLTETLTGGEFIRSGARRCIFVCVGHVLVRDSSGPLYGQGQERERERVWRLRAVWSVITHRDCSERAKSIAQTSNPPGEWKVCAGIPNKHKDGSNTDMTPQISLEVDIQIHDREEGRQTVGCNICLAW